MSWKVDLLGSLIWVSKIMQLKIIIYSTLVFITVILKVYLSSPGISAVIKTMIGNNMKLIDLKLVTTMMEAISIMRSRMSLRNMCLVTIVNSTFWSSCRSNLKKVKINSITLNRCSAKWRFWSVLIAEEWFLTFTSCSRTWNGMISKPISTMFWWVKWNRTSLKLIYRSWYLLLFIL